MILRHLSPKPLSGKAEVFIIAAFISNNLLLMLNIFLNDSKVEQSCETTRLDV